MSVPGAGCGMAWEMTDIVDFASDMRWDRSQVADEGAV
jgi:hypothetical protein